ncbi:MAG TPA: (d)CMP kinase [Solirubrobacterales bacterium]|nr:(d)CMP kinase [Solirubrobacterales bacterium]
MASQLRLRDLLASLANSDCDFVVIGSSALVLQGWDVVPSDLDLFVPSDEVDGIRQLLEVGEHQAVWVRDGEARRVEVETDRGPVDLYLDVSGDLTYERVERDAVAVMIGADELSVKVGSLAHVRDMRAAVGRPPVPADAVRPAEKGGAPRVVAIDGPAGAGKSTVTRSVARSLGFTYLDTGAMYRSVTLVVLEQRADPDDHARIGEIADSTEIDFDGERVLIGHRDVTSLIRSAEVTKATPHIAAYPEVRAAMVKRQRQLFSQGGYVAEGRDTGTVVAPDAPLKIYLTATPEERARRRSLETHELLADVLAAIEERDRLDSVRELSALKPAKDAVVLDTTGRSIDEVVEEIVKLARDRGIV